MSKFKYEISVRNAKKFFKDATEKEEIFAVSEKNISGLLGKCCIISWQKKHNESEMSACTRIYSRENKVSTFVRLPLTIKEEDRKKISDYIKKHISPAFTDKAQVVFSNGSISVSNTIFTDNKFFSKKDILLNVYSALTYSEFCMDLILESSHVFIKQLPDSVIKERSERINERLKIDLEKKMVESDSINSDKAYDRIIVEPIDPDNGIILSTESKDYFFDSEETEKKSKKNKKLERDILDFLEEDDDLIPGIKKPKKEFTKKELEYINYFKKRLNEKQE